MTSFCTNSTRFFFVLLLEFIQNLVTARYEYCDPCSVHYDNIIHFENLAEESDFLKSILDPDRSTDIGMKRII